MTKNFRLNKRFLLKITVPHHNYKVYCPINKNDLLNLSIRENEIIEKFHLKKDEIVVDVGAHYGRYTLIAAKHVGHNGKVIAIEADPKNMEILNKNIKLNKLNDENVITINYAVHSKETKIKLYTPAEETGHTIYNTIVPGRIKCEKFIEVKANTLDRLVEEKGVKHEDVNWIKIDVEGAELEVLKGAHNILSKSKDIALLIEVHNISEGQTLYENIMTLLQTYNFKIEFEKIHEGGERHVIMRKI